MGSSVAWWILTTGDVTSTPRVSIRRARSRVGRLLTKTSQTDIHSPDYPSLGHIASVARDLSVNIIWAVSRKHINLYTSLTDIIKASHAGMISSDSSNIVELIQVCRNI